VIERSSHYYTLSPGSYSIYGNNPTPSLSFPDTFNDYHQFIQYVFNGGTGFSTIDFSARVQDFENNHVNLTVMDVWLVSPISTMANVLGYQNSKIVSNTYEGMGVFTGWRFGSNWKLTSTTPVNFLYPGSIVVKIDQLNTNNRAIGFGLGEVFEIFHTDTSFGDIINFQPYTPFPSHIARLNLAGVLTVRLVDLSNQELDLHGSDWSITLGIQWGLDTGSAGFENPDTNHNYLPITNVQPTGYDSMQAIRKRPRG